MNAIPKDVITKVQALVLNAERIEQDNGNNLPIFDAAAFAKQYKPLDPVIDGIIWRGFLYALTAPTNHGKTAVGLLFALSIAMGRRIGNMDVTQGRVLILCGENPDDFRIRLIALVQHMGLSFDKVAPALDVVPQRFDLAATMGAIEEATKKRGPYMAVLVDTAAAYFSGDEENSNTQNGDHARNLRQLIERVPGRPAIIVPCHPTKAAARDNLLPRGGGAFVNEVDTNLTLWLEDDVAELSHTKIRGTHFQPTKFRFDPVTLADHLDGKGRPVTSVVAVPLAEAEAERIEDTAYNDRNKVLFAMLHHPNASLAEWASTCGWAGKKWKVQRIAPALVQAKLAKKTGSKYTLTAAGRREAEHVK
jgi:hypothetical protein